MESVGRELQAGNDLLGWRQEFEEARTGRVRGNEGQNGKNWRKNGEL